LGIPDIFLEHGPQALLREKYGIDENGIIKGVKKMFAEEWSGSASTSQSGTSVRENFPDPK
jgi:hypothetical protein